MSQEYKELLCRVCLEENELMVPIYEEVDTFQTDLSVLLERCGGITVHIDDVYPKFLCQNCTNELLVTAQFLQKCQQTEKLLKELHIAKQIEKDALEKPKSPEQDDLGFDCPIIDDPIELVPEEIDINELTAASTALADEITKITQLSGEESNQENVLIDVESTTSETIAATSHIISDMESAQLVNDCKDVHKITENDFKSYSCDSCGARFKSNFNLQRHIKKNHMPNFDYLCELCGDSYADNQKFQAHICMHQQGECEGEQIEPENNALTCPCCNKTWLCAFALEMHMRTHTGERPFQCKDCNKTYKTKSALDTHAFVHSNQFPFTCNLCDKGFYYHSNLQRHMLTHTGEKPHCCKICKKRFSRVFLLEDHMRKHTGEKPFACVVCDKKFSQRSMLRDHLTIHEKKHPYQCPKCTKSFCRPSHLTRHMKRHKEIKEEAQEDAQVDAQEDAQEDDQKDAVEETQEEVVMESEIPDWIMTEELFTEEVFSSTSI